MENDIKVAVNTFGKLLLTWRNDCRSISHLISKLLSIYKIIESIEDYTSFDNNLTCANMNSHQCTHHGNSILQVIDCKSQLISKILHESEIVRKNIKSIW